MNQELMIAILSGSGAMLGWGTADFLAKKAIRKIGDLTALFWVMIFGILPLLIYYLFNFSVVSISLNQWLWLGLFGLMDGGGYIFFYKALEKGQVSIISPLTASYAAIAVLISVLIFKEQITSIRWVALGLVFVGIMFTSIDFRALKEVGSRKIAKGVPEAMVNIILYGSFYPVWDNFLKTSNWIVMILLLRVIVAIMVGLFVRYRKVVVKVKGSKMILWLLVIGGLEGLAYFSTTWGLEITSFTSVVAVLGAAFSLPTVILARIFLKERVERVQLLGIVGIIGGLVLIAGS